MYQNKHMSLMVVVFGGTWLSAVFMSLNGTLQIKKAQAAARGALGPDLRLQAGMKQRSVIKITPVTLQRLSIHPVSPALWGISLCGLSQRSKVAPRSPIRSPLSNFHFNVTLPIYQRCDGHHTEGLSLLPPGPRWAMQPYSQRRHFLFLCVNVDITL